MVPQRYFAILLGSVLATFAAVARAELRAEELLLVVNGNSKVSVGLAEFYAQQRGVPEGRICRLDLPPTEEIPSEVYERKVVPAVRTFVAGHGLGGKVRCLVTFFGTPIRIGPVKPTGEQEAEARSLAAEAAQSRRAADREISALEAYARTVVPEFKAGDGDTFEALNQRATRAAVALAPAAQSGPQRAEVLGHLMDSWSKLVGDAGLLVRFQNHGAMGPEWAEREARVEGARRDIAEANLSRYDAGSRKRVRELTRSTFGLMDYIQLVQGQAEYLTSEESGAAFDSELSLVFVDWYSRAKWVRNVLHYSAGEFRGPPVMMVSRLDAPVDQMVPEMIATSIRVEREGLKGKVVLDARGPGASGAYKDYDETIIRLGALLKRKTKLDVVLDEKPDVLPAGSERDVAIYCGWYSVFHYIPACQFARGAVGYHIASAEMLSLRDPKDTGWVRGLMKDGVVGTLGPVAEPYLFAFPDADEFFPLLMTGKLTLAEVFWKTERVSSWQVALVGDPLYRPYAVNPPLAVEDLPGRLRAALAAPAAAVPATQATSRQVVPAASR
jgi:uncharacterized protein (TIGR03790 family)